MPTLLPMLRMRLKNAAPSLRRPRQRDERHDGERHVREARAESLDDAGLTMSGQESACGEMPAICHSEIAPSPKPIAISQRASTRPARRPTTAIATHVPMPRGAVTSPAASTG